MPHQKVTHRIPVTGPTRRHSVKSGPPSGPEAQRADIVRVPACTRHLRVLTAPVRASRNAVRNSAFASWRARAHQHESHQGLHRKVILEACGRRRGLARGRCSLRIRELHVHDVGVRRRCFGSLPATKPITRRSLIPGACVEDKLRICVAANAASMQEP